MNHNTFLIDMRCPKCRTEMEPKQTEIEYGMLKGLPKKNFLFSIINYWNCPKCTSSGEPHNYVFVENKWYYYSTIWHELIGDKEKVMFT